MMKHHTAAINELRLQHRSQLSMKQAEQKRKTADQHKEHEEELEALKQDQIQTMEG